MTREERRATKIKQMTEFKDPHRTIQSGRLDADINVIVATHARTGEWRNVNPKVPQYGDFSRPFELERALAVVNQANEEFAALPARVRALANNNPVEFLAMLSDPSAVDVLKAAGLPVKEPTPTTEPTPPPAPPAPPQ